MLKRIFLPQSGLNYLLALIFLLLTGVLGFQLVRTQFEPLLLTYGVFFALYLYVYVQKQSSSAVYFFVMVAILLRFLLVFSFPNLSDDVYRFIWDGRLLVNGINPFDHLPAYYIENGISIAGIDESLFQLLNSPEYFTIYPPVAQLNFLIANWLFPNSIYGATVMMKLQLFLFEIGAIYLMIQLLKHFQLPSKNVLLYALNPLIILEVTGNLHFEGAMICFLLLAIYLLIKNKWLWSAVAFALSIAAKLLPLMFLPFLIKRLGWRRSFSYFVVIGGVLLLLFIPLFSGTFFNNFGASLNLYFQKFEFNASIYYALRWVGYQWTGYNIIQELGPSLAVGTLTGILAMAFFEKKKKQKLGDTLKISPSLVDYWQPLFAKMLFAITLYLSFTTIVHPWYVALPLALCMFTNYRFPILWSAFIFLTYINYSYPVYQENLMVVAIEYIAVFSYAFYEIFRSKEQLSTVHC
ncbi:MAG: glycosyltransferase 87 family protein [Saprospiraceae bacterium]